MEDSAQQEKVYAYNPKEYGFIGFIFGLIPVFIMSLSNAGVFPNGEVIRKRMKIYMWIYIIGCLAIVATASLVIFNLYNNYPTRDTVDAVSNTANYVAASLIQDLPSGRVIADIEHPASSDTFINIVMYSKYVFFVFNFLMLVLIYRFSKVVELPVYIQLKESGRIVPRRFFVPVLIGLILPFFVYFLLDYSLGILGNRFL